MFSPLALHACASGERADVSDVTRDGRSLARERERETPADAPSEAVSASPANTLVDDCSRKFSPANAFG